MKQSHVMQDSSENSIFTFINDYPNFDLSLISSDAQLRHLLKKYLEENPAESLKIKRSLQSRLDGNPSDVEGWLEFVLSIGSRSLPYPLEVSEVLRENRNAVNGYVFRDSATFLNFYERFSDKWDELTEIVLDSSRFAANEGFLYDFNGSQWAALYPYFLAHRKVDRKYFLKKVLDCRENVRSQQRKDLIIKEIPDAKERAGVILALMRDKVDDDRIIGELTPLLIEAARPLGQGAYDFFTVFPNHIGNVGYHPLYTFSLETSRLDYASDIREFYKKLQLLIESGHGAEWIGSREASSTIGRLCEALNKRIYTREISYKEGLEICNALYDKCNSMDVRGIAPEVYEKLGLLRIVLGHEKGIPSEYLQKIWQLAEELDDKAYLKMLVPEYIRMSGSPNVISMLIDREYMTPSSALDYAIDLGRDKGGFPYILVLAGRIDDAPGKLDFLVKDCGYSDDEALSILEKYQPEAFMKIMKLRKPSIWSRLTGMFRKQPEEDVTPSSGAALNASSSGSQARNVPHGSQRASRRNPEIVRPGQLGSHSGLVKPKSSGNKPKTEK